MTQQPRAYYASSPTVYQLQQNLPPHFPIRLNHWIWADFCCQISFSTEFQTCLYCSYCIGWERESFDQNSHCYTFSHCASFALASEWNYSLFCWGPPFKLLFFGNHWTKYSTLNISDTTFWPRPLWGQPRSCQSAELVDTRRAPPQNPTFTKVEPEISIGSVQTHTHTLPLSNSIPSCTIRFGHQEIPHCGLWDFMGMSVRNDRGNIWLKVISGLSSAKVDDELQW